MKYTAYQFMARLQSPGLKRKGWVVLGWDGRAWVDVSWHRTPDGAGRAVRDYLSGKRAVP